MLKCKGWETDPNAYIYFTIQEQNWQRTCDAIGKPEWKADPAYATAKARQPHLFDIFALIEKQLAGKTKFEAVEPASKRACGPASSVGRSRPPWQARTLARGHFWFPFSACSY